MFYTYVLKSSIRNYIYVGITNNVERRFSEHNLGFNKTTKAYRPFVLLLVEQFADRESARIREKWYKSGEGKEFIKAHFM